MKTILFTLLFGYIIQGQLSELIYQFSNSKTLRDWAIIDDGVMGGVSRGSIAINENGNGVFSGTISTDNNGGFSLLRHRFNKKKVTGYNSISIRIKGDGKYYQFRIKSNTVDYYSYVSSFKTTGEWETIIIPFKNFEPQFRGRSINKPNYNGVDMQEIAFLIGNKKNEVFQLEIENITLLK